MRDALIVIAMAFALLVLSCTSAYGEDIFEGETTVKVDVGASKTDMQSELEALCGGPNAKVSLDGSGASFPSLPCESVRTDIALQRLEEREGFMASSTRGFLRARLFMRGLGSVLFGLFGLG